MWRTELIQQEQIPGKTLVIEATEFSYQDDPAILAQIDHFGAAPPTFLMWRRATTWNTTGSLWKPLWRRSRRKFPQKKEVFRLLLLAQGYHDHHVLAAGADVDMHRAAHHFRHVHSGNIVREPQVFLMDEPLSNLDAKLRNQMRSEILKLRQKVNTTFIYVTHDQTEAMTLGDRIVIMKEGFVQQVGTPQEVFHHPSNLFVAGFIGTPQYPGFPQLPEPFGQ